MSRSLKNFVWVRNATYRFFNSPGIISTGLGTAAPCCDAVGACAAHAISATNNHSLAQFHEARYS